MHNYKLDGRDKMYALMINHKQEESPTKGMVPWWSFGKTVLATAIFKLVEQKRLDLDASYFGLKGSVKQLLRHEAGLKDYYSNEEYHYSVARNDIPWEFEEMLERIQASELLFEPGNGWMYSNIGYAYIRKIIEKETNQPLAKALQTLIFDSIQIHDVKVATKPEDLLGCVHIAANYHPGWLYHGLILGELKYAVQFLDALADGQIISQDSLKQMREPHRIDFDIGNRPWENPGYAYGVMTDDRIGSLGSFGHTGTGPGSTIAVYHFPNGKNKVTVAWSSIEKDQGVSENEVIKIANANLY